MVYEPYKSAVPYLISTSGTRARLKPIGYVNGKLMAFVNRHAAEVRVEHTGLENSMRQTGLTNNSQYST